MVGKNGDGLTLNRHQTKVRRKLDKRWTKQQGIGRHDVGRQMQYDAGH
jgi:hypothetical protein